MRKGEAWRGYKMKGWREKMDEWTKTGGTKSWGQKDTEASQIAEALFSLLLLLIEKGVLSAATSRFSGRASLQIRHRCWICRNAINGFNFFVTHRFASQSQYFSPLWSCNHTQKWGALQCVCRSQQFWPWWVSLEQKTVQHFIESCLYRRSSSVGYFSSCTHTHTCTHQQTHSCLHPVFHLPACQPAPSSGRLPRVVALKDYCYGL